MLDLLIKKQQNRRTGRAWKEIMESKQEKATKVAQPLPAMPVEKQIQTVPVHPPHVVFDKSYVSHDDSPDMANLAKVSEDVRHLQFHHHGPEFAY